MENFSRRNFLRKLAAGAAASAVLANSAFALKRRPVDTRETMRRARGNVASDIQICDAFGSPKSAGMFDFSIVGDVLQEAKTSDEIRAKNSELASFCAGLKNAKFCAEIPLGSDSRKYLGEILSNPECAAVSARISKGGDAAGAEFLHLLEKSAQGGRPVYIFAKTGGGKFAREIADMEIAKAVLLLLESGAFEKFLGLKIVLPNLGIAAVSSLASAGAEAGGGVFYLIDRAAPRELFDFIKNSAKISQLLFASGADAEGSLARLEAMSLSPEQFKRVASKNWQSLFAVEK